MSDLIKTAISYMPDEKTLDFWIKHRQNVLFIGKHGVGKTTMIEEAFKRNGLKSRYFSASTMDPWVDFIGIPKEVMDENGKPYLELIKPKEFRDDEVEAIFFDELNRSHKKVRNAIMELIQFKSINGKKFPNLKMIWGAINPRTDNDPYDVEDLDPAQRDRFLVQVEIPYKPSKKYFVNKYGEDIGYDVCAWWDALPDKVKDYVSPRKLDGAVEFMQLGGNVRHVLPPCCNVDALIETVNNGSPSRRLKKLLDPESKTPDKDIVTFINDMNNFKALEKEIVGNETLISSLNKENLSSLFSTYPNQLETYFTANYDDHKTLLEDIKSKSPKSSKLAKVADKIIKSKTVKTRKTATIAISKKPPLVLESHYEEVMGFTMPHTIPKIGSINTEFSTSISMFEKKAGYKISPIKSNILHSLATTSQTMSRGTSVIPLVVPDKTQCDKIMGFLNYFVASSQRKTINDNRDKILETFAYIYKTGLFNIKDMVDNYQFILAEMGWLSSTPANAKFIPIKHKI